MESLSTVKTKQFQEEKNAKRSGTVTAMETQPNQRK